MKVKVCGIMSREIAEAACAAGADALGFVFARSKRQVTPEAARDIIAGLPASVLKIGVFVNETTERVEEISALCGLDYAQLHGEENAAYARNLRVPVIKAFGIGTAEEAAAALLYPADYILLDSPKGVYHGGNGTSFDWELLKDVPEQERQRLILAGGLGVHNVKEAAALVRPYMVDASSSLETDGVKDAGKIARFIEKAKESFHDNVHISRP